MRQRKMVYTILLCALAVGVLLFYSQRTSAAKKPDNSKYVGTQTCAMCHADVAKKWQLTVHRRTLFNNDPSMQGCEACHGPGADHVAGGGDKTKIIRFSQLKPDEISAICQKCHTQEEITLWDTSTHARAKLTCLQCHDPHSVGEKDLLVDVDNETATIEGLASALKQAELQANIAAKGSVDKDKANDEVDRLKTECDDARKNLNGLQSEYQRAAQPFVCYTCHKSVEVQNRLPSHHPIEEGKVVCTDCHNPHGGPNGMLREESVPETCARCHADKVGPFTFEHPPVTEDCTICHSPHGSVQPDLLNQSQPFLCLKCHVGPHSGAATTGNAAGFAQYYTNCTSCHTQPHGSDEHSALHF